MIGDEVASEGKRFQIVKTVTNWEEDKRNRFGKDSFSNNMPRL